MFTRAKIFRIISSYEDGQIFTTRELLHLGTRSAIDNALYNMVQEHIIERLAWGVFRLSEEYLGKRLAEPTLLEVATAKARAFARSIYTASFQIFCEEKKPVKVFGEDDTYSFKILGHSSCFRRVFKDRHHYITVKLQGLVPRKAALAATPDGGILESFWRLGKNALEPVVKSIALSRLRAPLKKAVTKRTKHLPSWITNNILFAPKIIDIDELINKLDGKNEKPQIDYEILDLLRAAHDREERGPDIFIDDSIEEGHDLEELYPPPVQDDEPHEAPKLDDNETEQLGNFIDLDVDDNEDGDDKDGDDENLQQESEE